MQHGWAAHTRRPWITALWSDGKGRRHQGRLGVGGRPFQVQMMTRKRLWGPSWGFWGEGSNLGSVVEFWPSLWPWLRSKLTASQNSPQKTGSYIISACQGRVLLQTRKRYIKKKKKKSETQGKEGKWGLWVERKWHVSWNRNFLRLFWAQFQEEVPFIKTNNH